MGVKWLSFLIELHASVRSEKKNQFSLFFSSLVSREMSFSLLFGAVYILCNVRRRITIKSSSCRVRVEILRIGIGEIFQTRGENCSLNHSIAFRWFIDSKNACLNCKHLHVLEISIDFAFIVALWFNHDLESVSMFYVNLVKGIWTWMQMRSFDSGTFWGISRGF